MTIILIYKGDKKMDATYKMFMKSYLLFDEYNYIKDNFLTDESLDIGAII